MTRLLRTTLAVILATSPLAFGISCERRETEQQREERVPQERQTPPESRPVPEESEPSVPRSP